MDYIFWSTLHGFNGPRITVSYDIVCQWHRNLFKRLSDLPEHLRVAIDKFILTFVIPKFHITAHGPKCQTIYSLNFLRNSARTDGENIERGWAWMNPASLSTREMGPGARRDTLDCQWSAWNWRILVKLGEYFFEISSSLYLRLSHFIGPTILRHFYEAVAEAREHRAKFIEFSKTFSPVTLRKWAILVDNWNADPQKAQNPYDEPFLGSLRTSNRVDIR